MWFINRTLMQKLIYNELNKVEDTRDVYKRQSVLHEAITLIIPN